MFGRKVNEYKASMSQALILIKLLIQEKGFMICIGLSDNRSYLISLVIHFDFSQ